MGVEALPKKGIMGGTFDPIHYGHLVTAEEVRDYFGLEEVVFVPSGRPPHKIGQKITDPEHRYLMVVLATITNPYFSVSRVEIERPGPSYSIDTVRYFKSLWGEDTEIYFITGADAFAQISTWNNPEELLRLCTFVAASRPGYRLQQLEEPFKDRVKIIEVSALAISSSEIRRRVKRGESIKYLLPEAVENYIYKNRLYRD
ncbi:nicotinate-nucleotide adenylyltransferase [Candidatus Caldatribacterium sp.]|uniref:nicotinate-nucleotide adenylyltransferase n=1 Tax=Candidatus Caldatribacterium sp. TaxID=2282143 RepID=UPI003873A4B9